MKEKENRPKISKKPWPTKAAMEQVYEKQLWGGHDSDYFSGAGSHSSELVNPYIEVVASFLNSFQNPLIVCDLGCGDFNIGKELVKFTKRYVAVDIVSELIQHNKSIFKAENLEFHALDLSEDELPVGDCAILRQVLQHLSNFEVQHIVSKLANYKYVILTEHLPDDEFTPNKDIISGQGIRLKRQSGLDLMAEPFSFKVKEEKRLLSIVPKDAVGIVVSTLYTNF